MKTLTIFRLGLATTLLLPSLSLLAQTNYVATSPASSSPGQQNTIVGINAGNNTMTGNYNAFLGYQAGFSNTIGSANTFVGFYAGHANTSGINNTFIGLQAGNNNTIGSENTFMGLQTGLLNTTGTSNVFMGFSTGHSNTTGGSNTFIGFRTGEGNITGYSNAFLGTLAGYSNQTGHNIVAIGDSAGYNNTISNNVFVGSKAGFSNSTGSFNVFTGAYAGYDNTIGSFNVVYGLDGGRRNTSGSFNTFMGHQAGATNATGNNNTFLGFRADVGSANLTNATAIGNGAIVNVSNALVLGSGANVGIGTSSPTNKLHVATGTANTSGLRLENLTSGSPATALNQTKFLTVDGSGNVILGSTNGSSAREAAVDALWERSGELVRSTASGGVVIGEGVSKTPAGYSLFVGQGLLAEKVKVAIKNTNEWSDRVFAPGYRLAPLSEVAQYVQTHQHLSGVPSAEEVVKEGVDVAQMNAKLLEKIEELTLYVVTLHNEVQQLRRQHTQPVKKNNAVTKK